ncbi:unnamed protein product, partial [Polarella glacialis]
MLACYPGASRARYHPHIDNDRSYIHRVLTAILYLNEDWQAQDGGQLRIFNEASLPLPQPNELGAKFDVEPLGNRLLLFWATEEVPHEVLATCRDRYACTVWLVDGQLSAADPNGALRICSASLQPVAPLSRDEALFRAAADPEHLAKLRDLANAAC